MSSAFAGRVVIACADELGADNGTSGCQGEENLDYQHVYGIHKGYAGNGGFAYVGNHQHIHHSHKDRKQLFYHKGPQQVKQLVFGEE